MLSAFDNFPALLIWLPVIGGLVSFFIKGEARVRTWAMSSTILTMAVMGVSLLYTDESHYLLNMVSYVWLNSLGASFALALDGLSRTLCLLTAISFPLIVAVAARNRYEQSNAFYGLLLIAQAGLMGAACRGGDQVYEGLANNGAFLGKAQDPLGALAFGKGLIALPDIAFLHPEGDHKFCIG